eukprot:Selendium_serpulae@DN5124_c0_g3_i1.p1
MTSAEPVAPQPDSPTVSQSVRDDLRKRCSHFYANIWNCHSLSDVAELNNRDFGTPVLGADKFCTGTLFGIASGYAAKKTAQAGLLVCGLGFASLQALNYCGYVDVKWQKISDDLTSTLDLNEDGKVDREDVRKMKDSALKVLTWGLPSAAGFGLGFMWGLKFD